MCLGESWKWEDVAEWRQAEGACWAGFFVCFSVLCIRSFPDLCGFKILGSLC